MSNAVHASQSSPDAHPFDRALVLEGTGAERCASVSADYQNMVGPFGGVTAALIVKAVMSHEAREGEPVALTVNYLGPIADTPLTIVPCLVRTNRSNQHWTITVSQDDVVQCTATLVLAERKPTEESVELAMPQAPAPSRVSSLVSDAFPAWVRQYDMRFVHGGLFPAVAVGDTPSESLVWMADKPTRALDVFSLTALCDAFFPRLFIKNQTLTPAGTVSLTIYFHCDGQTLGAIPSPYVLGKAKAGKYFGHYFDQHAQIWSECGTLLATTTQAVYYK